MGLPFIPAGPGFSITPLRTAFGTVVTQIIRPFRGPKDTAPLIYNLVNGAPNWTRQLYTHLTSCPVLNSSTANVLYFLRPLNWTTTKTAMAKAATAITLTDDPGVFSTNFRYPMPGLKFLPPGTAHAAGEAPSQVADNTLSANDFVAYQLDDGTWILDKIASGTVAGANVVLTTGTPNRNGGTLRAGAPVFFFGIQTDSVPLTGEPHLNYPPTVSVTEDLLGAANNTTGIMSLNPGDPLVLYNPNATATTAVLGLYGDYRAY